MTVVSRDVNNNMYPLSIAVVKEKTKDSWTWFLEAFVSDLGPAPPQGWTFISDRQKVSIFLFCILHLTNFHMTHLFETKYDIFYLTMCAGPSIKPQTSLSYS
jgi:hypothetical protein